MRLALDDPRWAAFVASRPEATPFHQPAWAGLLAECYRLDAWAFAVEDGGELAAGIPLVEARSASGGRRWVALPFTDACEPLGDAAALAPALDGARRGAKVALEVRAPLPLGEQREVAVVHRLELDPDPDAVFRRFSSSTRRNVRNAEKRGVSVRRAASVDDLAGTFFRLQTLTRRRFGLPVPPRRYYRLLWERVLEPGGGFALVAEAAGRPVAAAVFLAANGVLVYKYGASDAAAWELRPNNPLFAEAIRHGCELGYRVLDFGRSDLEDEGLRRFKASWGAEEQPLVYTGLGAPVASRAGTAVRVLKPVIRRSPPAVSRLLGAALYRYAG